MTIIRRTLIVIAVGAAALVGAVALPAASAYADNGGTPTTPTTSDQTGPAIPAGGAPSQPAPSNIPYTNTMKVYANYGPVCRTKTKCDNLPLNGVKLYYYTRGGKLFAKRVTVKHGTSKAIFLTDGTYRLKVSPVRVLRKQFKGHTYTIRSPFYGTDKPTTMNVFYCTDASQCGSTG